MRKTGFVLVVALAGASGCPSQKGAVAPVGGVRADATPGSYFPLAETTAWSYDVLDQQTGQTTLLVNRVQRRDGARAVFFEGADPLAYEDDGDHIVRLPSGATVLEGPMKAGRSWAVPGGTARIITVDEAVQAVHESYPHCVVVEELTNETRVVTSYALDVGPVKVEVYARGPAGEQLLHRGLLRGYHKAGSPSP